VLPFPCLQFPCTLLTLSGAVRECAFNTRQSCTVRCRHYSLRYACMCVTCLGILRSDAPWLRCSARCMHTPATHTHTHRTTLPHTHIHAHTHLYALIRTPTSHAHRCVPASRMRVTCTVRAGCDLMPSRRRVFSDADGRIWRDLQRKLLLKTVWRYKRQRQMMDGEQRGPWP
jgi:hypothetical protein